MPKHPDFDNWERHPSSDVAVYPIELNHVSYTSLRTNRSRYRRKISCKHRIQQRYGEEF